MSRHPNLAGAIAPLAAAHLTLRAVDLVPVDPSRPPTSAPWPGTCCAAHRAEWTTFAAVPATAWPGWVVRQARAVHDQVATLLGRESIGPAEVVRGAADPPGRAGRGELAGPARAADRARGARRDPVRGRGDGGGADLTRLAPDPPGHPGRPGVGVRRSSATCTSWLGVPDSPCADLRCPPGDPARRALSPRNSVRQRVLRVRSRGPRGPGRCRAASRTRSSSAGQRHAGEDLAHQVRRRPVHDRVGGRDDDERRPLTGASQGQPAGGGDVADVDVAPQVPLAQVRVGPVPGNRCVVLGGVHVGQPQANERDAAPRGDLPGVARN